MTWQGFPAPGTFLAGAGSNSTRCLKLEDFLYTCTQLLGGDLPESKAIVAGAITPVRAAIVVVDTQGAAPSDDLDTINSGGYYAYLGMISVVTIASSSRKVVVRHGAGNIRLTDGQNFTMAHTSAKLFLFWDGTNWIELWRHWGGDHVGERAWLGIVDAATNPIASNAEADAGTANDRLMTPFLVARELGNPGLLFNRAANTTLTPSDEILVCRGGTLGTIFRQPLTTVLSAGFSQRYTSPEIVIGNNAFGQFGHGLSDRPVELALCARCKVADNGYTVGEEWNTDLPVGANATNVFYQLHNVASPLRLPVRGTGIDTAMTSSSWRLFIKAAR